MCPAGEEHAEAWIGWAQRDQQDDVALERLMAGVPAPEAVAEERVALRLDDEQAPRGVDDEQVNFAAAGGPTGTRWREPADVRGGAGGGRQGIVDGSRTSRSGSRAGCRVGLAMSPGWSQMSGRQRSTSGQAPVDRLTARRAEASGTRARTAFVGGDGGVGEGSVRRANHAGHPARLRAPWSESVSALRQISRRGSLTRGAVAHTLEAILVAPIDRVSPPGLARRAWDIADRLGWANTYDAEYVALAHALGLPLLTRDARLGRGAARVVEVLGPADL